MILLSTAPQTRVVLNLPDVQPLKLKMPNVNLTIVDAGLDGSTMAMRSQISVNVKVGIARRSKSISIFMELSSYAVMYTLYRLMQI